MMTDPRRYLVRMIIFLVVVAAIAALLHAPLLRAFMGNPALNGVILGVLLIGIIYTFRQNLRLLPERRWLTMIQKTGKLDNRQVKPVLLATVYAMLADQRQYFLEHLAAVLHELHVSAVFHPIGPGSAQKAVVVADVVLVQLNCPPPMIIEVEMVVISAFLWSIIS